MMYQNKLVAAIKVNGRILRETHGTVLIPFGSEYAILVKNLNSVRAKVKISVDGTDATDGTWLVVAPNSSIELERFIRHGNWQSGNRFKFIERSGDVEAHRGIQAEDGIVRVEFATERRQAVIEEVEVRKHYYDEWHPVPRPYYPPPPHWPWPYRGPQPRMRSASRSSGGGGMRSKGLGASAGNNTQSSPSSNFMGFSQEYAVSDSSTGDAGITVAGSESHQTFHAVSDFPTDQSDVMVLMLRGIVGDQVVTQPLTVDAKLTCATCGKVSKSGVQFCAGCGTALALV